MVSTDLLGTIHAGFILAQCAIKPQLSIAVVQKCVSDLAKLLEDESAHICASAAIAIGHIGLRGMQLLGSQSQATHVLIVERLIKLLGESDHKVVVNVIKGIGFLCRGLPDSSDEKKKLVDGKAMEETRPTVNAFVHILTIGVGPT